MGIRENLKLKLKTDKLSIVDKIPRVMKMDNFILFGRKFNERDLNVNIVRNKNERPKKKIVIFLFVIPSVLERIYNWSK